MRRQPNYLWLFSWLLLPALACSTVVATPATPLPPPPTLAISFPTSTPFGGTSLPTAVMATITLPVAEATATLPAVEATATLTDTPTPTATATITATATPTVPVPLQFSYVINWQFVPDNDAESIATVTITAWGGDGNYTYYHDDLLQPGAEFTYRWASCRANPGSFRVDSGDGQSQRINYYEEVPCPTP